MGKLKCVLHAAAAFVHCRTHWIPKLAEPTILSPLQMQLLLVRGNRNLRLKREYEMQSTDFEMNARQMTSHAPAHPNMVILSHD